VFLGLVSQGCDSQDTGISLADGWVAEIVTENGNHEPDMLVLSPDQHSLYQSCETRAGRRNPSLARIDIDSGRREILISGLGRADGLKLASDDSLWLGEERPDGLVWRILRPMTIAAEQRLVRDPLHVSHPDIQAVPEAGRFAHEGIAFSADDHFLYLADEWTEGCLYRFSIIDRRLEVLRNGDGWQRIKRPESARIEAKQLHGRQFNRIEDLERLPDGRILMAETGSGRILALDESSGDPAVAVYLQDPILRHPDNLEWDGEHDWLWITDDSSPSILWAWDGKRLREVAHHESAEITGVESAADGSIYIDLQHRRFGPDLTLRLKKI